MCSGTSQGRRQLKATASIFMVSGWLGKGHGTLLRRLGDLLCEDPIERWQDARIARGVLELLARESPRPVRGLGFLIEDDAKLPLGHCSKVTVDTHVAGGHQSGK